MRTYYIYKISNTLNSKLYIGQTIHPKIRWWQHKSDAKNPEKTKQYIHRAMSKHGIENFTYEVIDFAFTQSQADCIETALIKLHQTRNKDKGYNLMSGGKVSQHSEATKKIIADYVKANPVNSWVNYTEEEKQERLDNLYDAGFGNTNLKGENHPMFGKTHSPEAIAKIKQKRANQVLPAYTEERREKLRKSNTGKSPSEETRAKMSLSAKNRNKNRVRNSKGQF